VVHGCLCLAVEGPAGLCSLVPMQTHQTSSPSQKVSNFPHHRPQRLPKNLYPIYFPSIPPNMSKRAAEPSEKELETLKSGSRPMEMEVDTADDVGEFEDEFEDEYESEDEIFEAGVDGRPDEEREAEEKEGNILVSQLLNNPDLTLSFFSIQQPWRWTKAHSFPAATNCPPARPSLPIFLHTKCSILSKPHGRVSPAT